MLDLKKAVGSTKKAAVLSWVPENPISLWGGIVGVGWSATGVEVGTMGYIRELKLGGMDISWYDAQFTDRTHPLIYPYPTPSLDSSATNSPIHSILSSDLSSLGNILSPHLVLLWLHSNPRLTGNLATLSHCQKLESLVLQGNRAIEGDLQVRKGRATDARATCRTLFTPSFPPNPCPLPLSSILPAHPPTHSIELRWAYKP